VIISTARPERAIREFVPPGFSDYYWAACNGAWILRAGQMLRRMEITNQATLSLVEHLQRAGLRVLIEADNCIFTDGHMPPNFVGEAYPVAALAGRDACKVVVHLRAPEEAGTVRAALPEGCQCVFTDGARLAQISVRGCEKLEAVRWILAQAGRGLAETAAFGDDANDISLLSAAGCGVAMGNASAEVKAAAAWQTAANDADGVGLFLENLLDQAGAA
jgi:hydroxymethylpyrimidine pyrophosphatase-like HAD family hydrolase